MSDIAIDGIYRTTGNLPGGQLAAAVADSG
jgi:hypothetical protein